MDGAFEEKNCLRSHIKHNNSNDKIIECSNFRHLTKKKKKNIKFRDTIFN